MVLSSLASLIHNQDLNSCTIQNSDEFNHFLQISFEEKREYRASVSQLAEIFKRYGGKKPGTLAVRYAKSLESMARDLKLEGFIV